MSNFILKLAGTAALAFTLAACGTRAVDTMEEATFDTNYGNDESAAFGITFDGRHDGLMTRRTITFPCSILARDGISKNIETLDQFRIKLTPQAKSQTEDIMLEAKAGHCAVALKR